MSSLPSATNYNDLAGLSKLKRVARSAPDQGLQEVAQQFESIFINTMLKSMRKASLGEGVLSNAAVDLHTGMLDSQLALNMSQSNKGLGLAEMLAQQLTPGTGPGHAAVSTHNSIPDSTVRGGGSSRESDNDKEVVIPSSDTASGTRRGINRSPAVLATSAYQSGDRYQQFVSELWPHAQASARELGVSPQLLVAQAVHETGWGQGVPLHGNGLSSHNLFGIKQGSQWQGKVVAQSTHEYVNGVAERQHANFRAYDSWSESFADYVKLIKGSSRYGSALKGASQGNDAAYLQGLQAGGYATDPHYAERVMAVMQGDRLQQALATSRSQAGIAANTSTSRSQAGGQG